MADENDLPPVPPGEIHPHEFNPTKELLEWLTRTMLRMDIPDEAREEYMQLVTDSFFTQAVGPLFKELSEEKGLIDGIDVDNVVDAEEFHRRHGLGGHGDGDKPEPGGSDSE